MISALGWIRRESAAVKPSKYHLSESDYDAFMTQANEQLSKTREEAAAAGIDLDNEMNMKREKPLESENDDDDNEEEEGLDVEMINQPEREGAVVDLTPEEAAELAKYNLDDYDEGIKNKFKVEAEEDDEDSDSDNDMDDLNDGGIDNEEENGIFMPISKLIKKSSKGGNDYLPRGEDEEFDEDELDDLTLRPSDLLFVAAKTEDEISQLEIYVYEEQVQDESTGAIEENLYVHHDLMLPSFPLCLEWIDYPFNNSGAEQRNFVAVGSFEKQIEIWNLDVLDLVYPTVSLSGHGDAVMSLAWNRQGRNFLASGSADNSVKLWDFTRPQEALRSFSHHCNKVQSVTWNPSKATELLSVAYDGLIHLFDVRSPQQGLNFASKMRGDVEQAKWRPDGSAFAVSDESGRLCFYDPRRTDEALAVLDAHGKAATCIDFCPVELNGNSIFLTASADKSLKVWSIDPSATSFNCLISKEMGVGKIFAAGFLPDAPLIIGAAGNRGNVNMWNLKKEDVIKSYFSQ